MLRKALAIAAVALGLSSLEAVAQTSPTPAPSRPAPDDSRGFFLWYQFPGQRWSSIGPLNPYDAQNLEADYQRKGARTAIVNHP